MPLQKYRVAAFKDGRWSWRHLEREETLFSWRYKAQEVMERLLAEKGSQWTAETLRVEPV